MVSLPPSSIYSVPAVSFDTNSKAPVESALLWIGSAGYPLSKPIIRPAHNRSAAEVTRTDESTFHVHRRSMLLDPLLRPGKQPQVNGNKVERGRL